MRQGFLNSVSGAAIAGISLGLVIASPAVAEEVQSDRGGGLGEIIVTAQKRTENLQETPIAITALSGEMLESRGVLNLADLGPSLPNVVIGGASSVGNSAASFYVRGIGLDRSTLALEAGVGLYIDDMYYGRSAGAFLSLLDVSSIEVLRGPQGTLFGKNTIGGAIRYVTKDPDFTHSGSLDVNIGQRQRVDVRGTMNLPVSDTLAIKLSAGSFNVDGYVENLVDGRNLGDEHTHVARGQFLWEPSSRFKVLGSADYTSSRNGGAPFTTVYINGNAAVAQRWNALHPDTPLDNRYSTPLFQNNRNPFTYELEGFGLNLNASYEVSDNLTIKSITGYRKNDVVYGRDDDGSPLKIYHILFNQSLPSFSQELQFVGGSSDDKIKYVAGLYYFWEGPSERQDRDIFFEPVGSHILENLSSKSYAAFGQLTAEVLPNLEVTLGARYTHDVKSVDVARPLQGLAGANSASFDDFSPKGVISYKWSPSVMTYVSVSKGYRAGGFNNSLTAAEPTHTGVLPFDSEDAWSYEVGAKTQLFSDRLRFNVAAFHNDYTNLQLTSPQQGLVLLIQNVGKARIRGFEVETDIAPLPGLTFGGSFGYLDAKYTDVGGATGITANSILAGAPKYSYSAYGNVDFDMSNGGMISFRLDYGGKSSIKSYATDAFAVISPPYALLNAQLRYQSPDRNFSIALQGKNVTNKTYWTTGFDVSGSGPGLVGQKMYLLGRPSEYYVTVSHKF